MEDLFDGGGDIADISDLGSGAGAHQERRLLHGVVSDRDDEIGALDRIMDIVALGQRRSAEIQLGIAGDRAFPHLRIEKGYLRLSNEIGQRVHQPRPVSRGANHD